MDLAGAFARLTERLEADRPDWSPRPLFGERARWEDAEPDLVRWLDAGDDAWLDTWEGAADLAPGAPAPLRRRGAELRALAEVAALPRRPAAPVRGLEVGIPGRKWAQVKAFAEVVAPGGPIVDWCGGKGHLGRTLGRLTGHPVTLVDHDAALCADAEALARADGAHRARVPVALSVRCADVLRAPPPLTPGSVIVALHACGALGDAAADEAVRAAARRLAWVPCCPHRLDGASRWPRSALARALGWAPTRVELRLVSTDEAVAGAGARRKRRAALEAAAGGVVQARRARARQAVRALYRRPLELWAVLDRALALAEAGADVRVGSFCPTDVTPRNLLVDARFSS